MSIQSAADEATRNVQAQLAAQQSMSMGGGRPDAPTYIPGYNSSMALSPQLNAWIQGTTPNQQGLNKYRQEATRTGPSVWASLSNQQQQAEQMNQQNQAARTAGSAGAEAQSQLAMSGGLSSGARERVAKDASRNYLGMSQNIAQQGGQNRMQIGINDEQNRISQLGALPGMENANSSLALQRAEGMGQGRQFDVTNQIGENRNLNEFNLGRYHEQMGAWGAGQQANATANSGKK